MSSTSSYIKYFYTVWFVLLYMCMYSIKIIMSFKKSDSKIKSFVTEEEAQDISIKRQEEWEKVRRPEDPLEHPEEEHRSLFEQLQEQKEKVQQEHDEKYNLKNMFRGIDNDEAAFLEFASQQQAEIDGRRYAMTSEVKEFRSEVAQLQTPITPGPTSPVKLKPTLPQSNKKSQVELLAGVIKTKRKRSETDDVEQTKAQDSSVITTDCAATSLHEVDNEVVKKKRPSEESRDESETATATQMHSSGQYPGNNSYYNRCSYKAFSIPGLGMYSDSSDSESSSSDSDILPSLFTFSASSNHK